MYLGCRVFFAIFCTRREWRNIWAGAARTSGVVGRQESGQRRGERRRSEVTSSCYDIPRLLWMGKPSESESRASFHGMEAVGVS